MTNPNVVISILNWNGAAKTIACLESVRALDYDNYTVIVVDNASRDDSVTQIRAAFPDVELLQAETNLGFASGHRFALDHVLAYHHDAALFWVLNNDATVRPDTLTALVAAYERHGDAIYGSVNLHADGDLRVQFGGGWEVDAAGQPAFRVYNVTRGMAYDRYLAEQKERIVVDVTGSSLMVPLAVIRQHGFFDEAFFFYAEETDYCLRMGKRGVPSIIVPESAIVHEGAGSFTAQSSDLDWVRLYYRRRNLLMVAKRHRTKVFFLWRLGREIRRCGRALLSSLKHNRRLVMTGECKARCFAVRDVILNRMGKTYAPEDYL
ncbi:MAG: glycosyltransferase family 2 protein [Anaerolineae bacterium]|nr:glycosyltransferase family 2 protein [Anaerolineae bacterium]